MKHLLLLAILALAIPAYAQINCPNGFTSPGFGNANVNGEQACGVNTVPYPAGQAFGADSSNGNISGSNIILIPGQGGHAASSLMYETPVNVQSFTTTFTFIPDGKNIAITWNNTTNQQGFEGGQFDGGAGCEAGFYQAFTNPEINNVFALELDSSSALSSTAPYPYTFTYSSTQIYSSQQSPCIPAYTGSDGKVDFTPSKISTYPVPVGNSPATSPLTTNGHTYSATVAYDGSNVTLDLYDVTAGGSCPGSECFTYTWPNINIPSLVGGNTAYVGLTGGTNGDNSGPLTIQSMTYKAGSITPPPPPPTVVATPTFSPAAGTYTSAQTVTLSDTTSGASIFYAINGGTVAAYTKPLSVGATETITAYATATGDTQSATGSAAYTINIPPTVTLSIPAQTLPISIQTSNGVINATITIPAQTLTLPQ